MKMLRAERRKLRKQLMILVNTPHADVNEIQRLREELGLNEKELTGPKDRTPKHISAEQYINWRKEGLTQEQICDIIGIPLTKLHSELMVLREKGLIQKGVIPHRRGQDAIKITLEEYLEDSKTMNDSEIAKKWGCAPSTICKKRRYEWGLPRKNNKTPLTYEQYLEYKKKFPKDVDLEIYLDYAYGTIQRLKATKWVMEE